MPPKSGKAAAGRAPSTSPDQVKDGLVISLTFDNISAMADALARVSSYLEDPVYEGQPASLYKFAEMNVPAKRYAGHNFSADDYLSAIQLLEQLSPAESAVQKELLNAFRRGPKDRSKIYVIANVYGDTATFSHERQHAVFYFMEDYRKRVEGIWKTVEKGYATWAQQFEKHLGTMYCSRVWMDEFQAIVLNREYECTTKVVQLLQSVVPKEASFPFTIVEIRIKSSDGAVPSREGTESGDSLFNGSYTETNGAEVGGEEGTETKAGELEADPEGQEETKDIVLETVKEKRRQRDTEPKEGKGKKEGKKDKERKKDKEKEKDKSGSKNKEPTNSIEKGQGENCHREQEEEEDVTPPG